MSAYQDELVYDSRSDYTASPRKTFNYALNALLEVQGAEMYTRDVAFCRDAVNHLYGQTDSVILDLLIIMLQNTIFMTHYC